MSIHSNIVEVGAITTYLCMYTVYCCRTNNRDNYVHDDDGCDVDMLTNI